MLTSLPIPLVHGQHHRLIMAFFFKKYVLLIMLLQLSHFFSSPLFPSTLYPSSHPHSPTLVHVHGSYIEVLWVLHFLYYSQPPSVYFVPTIYASYSLYLSPILLTDKPPCDLYFCEPVPILVVCLVLYCFCFCFHRFGC